MRIRLTQNGKETERDRGRGKGSGKRRKEMNMVASENEIARHHSEMRDRRMRFDEIRGIMVYNKANGRAREQVGIKKYHIHKRTARPER